MLSSKIIKFSSAILLFYIFTIPLTHAADSNTSRISRFGEYQGYSEAQFESSVRSSFYITMRDGVRLAIDVHRPANNGQAAEGKFPVIWQGTISRSFNMPFNPESPGFSAMTELTRFGYVVVNVERRGTGASFGARRGYHDRNEANDAYEVTEWLAKQDWSNGKIGVWGCSNTGEAAMHVVSAAPPHLKAAFAGCFSWNKYDGMFRGGIFANWGTGPERTFEQDMQSSRPVDADADRQLLRQAVTQHQNSTVLFDLWKGMPYRDSFSPLVGSRFWSEGSVSSYIDQVRRSDVAVYIVGGWQDDFRREGLVAYANLPEKKRHIMIGPWRHCANTNFNLLAEAHRFFDFYLKGIANGIDEQDPVHYFAVNDLSKKTVANKQSPSNESTQGTWHASNTWPPANSAAQPFYLGEGKLLDQARSTAETKFQVNYQTAKTLTASESERVPGGTLAMALAKPSTEAQSQFISSAVENDTEITGHPIADLWIETDATELNLFVYLEDVSPDGSITVVTDARLRASHRKLNQPPYNFLGLPWHRSFAEDIQTLKPGEATQLVFDFLPTSYVFKQGHKIRVSVTGADFRERDRIESSPAPRVSILNSTEHSSVISLPIKD